MKKKILLIIIILILIVVIGLALFGVKMHYEKS